jgi:hypothetical protein
MDNLNMLLEGANPWKSQQAEAARVATKWQKSGLLEGMSSEIEKNNMAVILENQAKQLVVETNITAGTNSMLGGTGENWAGIALPLVRRVFAEIVAKDFVSVQPMSMPSGLVFYLDFQYGNNKNPFQAGKSLYGSLADVQATNIDITNVDPTGGLYGQGRYGYSMNQFSASVTVTTASYATAASDSLAPFVNYDSRYIGTSSTLYRINIADSQLATLALPDFLSVQAWIPSGSGVAPLNVLQQFTNYVSGSGLNFITNVAPSVGAATTVLFYNKQTTPALRGDFEADNDGIAIPNAQDPDQIAIPTINIQLKSDAIVAKTRKLKAQWTPELAQDLNAYQNIDAEAELTGLLSQYIAMEIDLEILSMLTEEAATTGYWSATNNKVWNSATQTFDQLSTTGNGYYNTQGGWFATLGTVLQSVSNKILQKTLRGQANFLVISPVVATIMQSIPGYASDAGAELDKVFNFGSQKIGTLNSRYKVYVNPYFSDNVILMGYKGAQFLESGAVYAPYVPLLMTPLVYDPETFTPRKGIMTRYAKKMVRPEFYGKVFVNGLNNLGQY